MLTHISVVQVLVFLLFFFLEKRYPARHFPRAKYFHLWWVFINGFALTLSSMAYFSWTQMPSGLIANNWNKFSNGLLFYLIWSLVGYWWHRIRHSVPILWKVVHRFHHSPQKMEAALAFFKHPIEYACNLTLATFFGWLFSIPPESIVMGLAIEGMLEIYHHSNIKTHPKLRWMGYFIQTPEMHLVHHQRFVHRYNYGAIWWDTVFGTVKIPKEWKGEQGFKRGHDILRMFLLKP